MQSTRKRLFHRNFSSIFFINADSNLTQTQILTLKPTPNLTQTQTIVLIVTQVNEKCADEFYSLVLFSLN